MFFCKWKKCGQQEPSESMEHTLSDLVRGMQYCVNSASEIVERQHLASMEQYFDAEGRPIMYPIQLPDGGSMKLPLFALMNHSALRLDEMKVSMAVAVSGLSIKNADAFNGSTQEVYQVERASFRVRMGDSCKQKSGNSVQLEMTFKSGDPPEAVARIVDRLTNCVPCYQSGKTVPKKED